MLGLVHPDFSGGLLLERRDVCAETFAGKKLSIGAEALAPMILCRPFLQRVDGSSELLSGLLNRAIRSEFEISEERFMGFGGFAGQRLKRILERKAAVVVGQCVFVHKGR